MQAYSDVSRESDPHALPDVEVFYLTKQEAMTIDGHEPEDVNEGWYYRHCFPGCLPDSDPMGPYDTESEALAAARDES